MTPDELRLLGTVAIVWFAVSVGMLVLLSLLHLGQWLWDLLHAVEPLTFVREDEAEDRAKFDSIASYRRQP